MSFSQSPFVSPLRYPGGKTAIANFIKLLLRQNDLVNGQYVEVYAGGAGIAWSLLFEEYVRHVFINDMSKSLCAFWHSVIYDADNLCKLIYDTPITIQE
jgi:DNA adenine methylase